MTREIFTPGRTELAGNHTDHQQGRILASGVDLGLSARCERNDSNVILIHSEGYEPFAVSLDALSPREEERGLTRALVRGVAASLAERGAAVGGFEASIRSTVPPGAGLSSSAAFSVLIGRILNTLYNGGRIDAVTLAHAAQEAENRHFGKPCGLMDQLACALGHTVYADFKTGEIEAIEADFATMGLQLCLTDTGGSHAGLDAAYAAIPRDMKSVAARFGKQLLGELEPARFAATLGAEDTRPIRRARHFFAENERVPMMRDALRAGDGEAYLRLMNESGRSSEQLLENIVAEGAGDDRLARGLALSEELLAGRGAWRVHGGGFAGCVQALMPLDYFETYRREMEAAFGPGACRKLRLA